ncbi:MAG: heme-binding protein [Methanomicrobiales archaeon]|nr:heme-binding protein [Methanomicrobiales archaeon]MDI6875467.1 heme-binding protein [Methanomicrobiales archaeon]
MRKLIIPYGVSPARRRSVAVTLQYEKVGTIGEVELRRYPKLLVACAPRVSDYEAHMILYRYFSGRNRGNERLEMTAPVISDEDRMCFVIPSGISREKVPEPLDDRIRILEMPEREIAALRFSGHADEPLVARETVRLLSMLRESGYNIAGSPFLMRYNPPTVAGPRRRNEVAVEIRRV